MGNQGGTNITNILTTLPNLTTLYLDLSRNDINDAGAASIAEKVKLFTKLTSFEFRLNSTDGITNTGGLVLANAMATLTNLTFFWFDLRQCSIDPNTKSTIRDILSNIAHNNQTIEL
jgi:hypothetical protein